MSQSDLFKSYGLFKSATAKEEGNKRILYLEASKEDIDSQGEIILQSALVESIPYYLKFGNIDINHITQKGSRDIENPLMFDIGDPLDVSIDDEKITYVKAEIRQGEGASIANYFWSSIKDTTPPVTWYASIAGEVKGRDVITKADGTKAKVITAIRWTNTALSRTPVLWTLNPASTDPIGEFAKALEIGFETDAALMTGPQSLVKEDVDKKVKVTTYDAIRDIVSQSLIDNADYDTLINRLSESLNSDYKLHAEYLTKYVQELYSRLVTKCNKRK